MVMPSRGALRGLVLAGVATAALSACGDDSAAPAAAARADVPATPREDVPRIDLARLSKPAPQAPIGQRNIFDFGAPPTPEPTPEPEQTPEPEATPTPVPTPVPPPTPVPLPPLTLKFIGSIQNKRGLRVAVLLTDKKDILTGQEGEVMANRFRIVKIGLESVDLQEVGSERVQRLPLKGE
jgi:hypothetical protein